MRASPSRVLRVLASAVVCAVLTLAFCVPRAWTAPDPQPDPPPDAEPASEAAAPPRMEGFTFIGLNRHGAEEWVRAADDAVVIRVPAGSYLARPYEGDGITAEPKPVEVASYLIDKHEVTNAQVAAWLTKDDVTWKQAVEAGWIVAAAGEAVGLAHRSLIDGGQHGAWWTARGGKRMHPCVDLTGVGAQAFAAWAGGALPTKAQWEKAAGGSEGRIYPWGDAAPDAHHANFGRPAPRGLMPVGSFAAGASPYGLLDMAGNAYERVQMRRGERTLPIMIKGGSWLTPHPLNLRVLDMCVQAMPVADASVGFRLVMADPQPARATYAPVAAPVLKLANDWQDAVAQAQEERKPILLSLQYDTCGQCDRIRMQLFRDPRFVAYCNEHMIVIVGHHPGDAGLDPHPEGEGGQCPLYAGLECWEHITLFRQGLKVVGAFGVSPGNFVLHPDHAYPGAGPKALLVAEGRLSKWGGGTDGYLRAFDEARQRLAQDPAPDGDG